MTNKTITTTHPEIGYTKNVEIIATALREQFGINDGSHVATAVAAHIWSHLTANPARHAVIDHGYRWGTREISDAVSTIRIRLTAISQQVMEATEGAVRPQ